MELTELTITQAHKGLKNKEFTSVDLTKAYLGKIKKSDLNTFISVTEDLALQQAEQADKKIASGNFDELTGVPCAIKDAIMVEGQKCTAGSKILENYLAPYDATVIKKMKEKGVVILGKTNLDEFAMGGSGENSAYGVTKNPHDKSLVPGGSSGGSAASVILDMVPFAIGTDTGGSIRLPAAFCGAVGYKPTYGLVSRSGVVAMASSTDVIGPLTKTVADAAIVLDVLAGKDDLDSTTIDRDEKSYADLSITI